MPSLTVPKAGLSLDPSLAKGGFDAYNVTLPDNVIEDMIKCVRNGKGIQLSLGPNPVSSIVLIVGSGGIVSGGQWLAIMLLSQLSTIGLTFNNSNCVERN